MKKYQIVEVAEQSNHAGKKAPADVATIAYRLGYKQSIINMCTSKKGVIAKLQRQIEYQKDWKRCFDEIPKNATVLIQNPYHNRQLTRNAVLKKLKEKKSAHFISLIHDVEELRKAAYNSYYKKEFEFMLRLSDVFVVHNNIMKAFFVKKGIPEERIVVLEIFDYLYSCDPQKPNFSKTVSIAGNLDIYKSRYIGELIKIKDVEFNLYGGNFEKSMSKYNHINYCGSFPVDEIPKKLNEGFGLVWDGESINTCDGNTGEYLKYNNPHKLSLYLASGIPVIIWEKAAEADFVRKNHLGICVASLFELSEVLKKIDKETYVQMANNVSEFSKKITNGYYTYSALQKAEKLISMGVK